MGPLIPQEIITSDLNFFFALIIGIAFGFILEQAGFSSSRKLAGVFYGYDFVVLKVFFTAAVTAATGLFFLKYMGWIDFDFLYVNPLYLKSAIIGGVIMGFGFILGGFCPGTSITAAVIGKIDAWFFIAGLFLGIFIYGLFFPIFQPLYTASYLGSPFIYETLGISQKWFLFFLIIIAMVAFAVTQMIEDNSTKFKELLYNNKLSIKYPAIFFIILAFIAISLPTGRHSFMNEKSEDQLLTDMYSNKRYVHTDKVALSLVKQDNALNIVDVRSLNEYTAFHLPGASFLPLNMCLNKSSESILKKGHQTTVLYSNSCALADMVWIILTRHGYNDIYVLEGGLNKFYNDIFNEDEWPLGKTIDDLSVYKFRKKASKFLKEGNAATEAKSIPMLLAPPVIKVKGGC